MLIINLTIEPVTQELRNLGVVDLEGITLKTLHAAHTFNKPPTPEGIYSKANFIADLAVYNNLKELQGNDPYPNAALIGGNSYLMSALEEALSERYITPLYSFKAKCHVELEFPGGGLQVVSEMKHIAFVRGYFN